MNELERINTVIDHLKKATVILGHCRVHLSYCAQTDGVMYLKNKIDEFDKDLSEVFLNDELNRRQHGTV